ncbi:MAG: hypothetical protein IPM11_01290 [Micropruina sp.]|nr:hypothetical protein [Micropruina sp.]
MTDVLFHRVSDMQVVLLQRGGVYRQTEVYSRMVGGELSLFAKAAGGFVMLAADGGTSSPTVSWIDLHNPGGYPVSKGTFGRPVLG